MLARAIQAGDSSIQVGSDYVVYAEICAQSWVRVDANSMWLSPIPSSTLFPIESDAGWTVDGEYRGFASLLKDEFFFENLLDGDARAQGVF